MLSYSQFIEEQRKRGNVSGALAAIALAGHMGLQVAHEIIDPGRIRRRWNDIYNPSLETHLGAKELANYLQNLHPHEVVVKPKAKPEQEKENEKPKTPTRRP